MPVRELGRRPALEVDEINALLDARAQLRGIRRGLIRILEIAAAHEQQRFVPRHECEIADLLAVVLCVAGQRLRRGAAAIARELREPDIALPLGIANPGKALRVRCADEPGCERCAEDLLDRKRVRTALLGRREARRADHQAERVAARRGERNYSAHAHSRSAGANTTSTLSSSSMS